MKNVKHRVNTVKLLIMLYISACLDHGLFLFLLATENALQHWNTVPMVLINAAGLYIVFLIA